MSLHSKNACASLQTEVLGLRALHTIICDAAVHYTTLCLRAEKRGSNIDSRSDVLSVLSFEEILSDRTGGPCQLNMYLQPWYTARL